MSQWVSLGEAKAIFSGSWETRDQLRPKALKTDHGRLAEFSLINFQFQDMEVQP